MSPYRANHGPGHGRSHDSPYRLYDLANESSDKNNLARREPAQAWHPGTTEA